MKQYSQVGTSVLVLISSWIFLAFATSAYASPRLDVLYGINSQDDGLSTIDATTGEVNFIGRLDPDETLFTEPSALAVRPRDDRIFVWNNANGSGATGELLTVNPCTGRGTRVDPETPNQGPLSALVFAPDGRLLGFDQYSMFEIDPATGVKTLITSNLGVIVIDAELAPSGNVYALTLNQQVGAINPVTGANDISPYWPPTTGETIVSGAIDQTDHVIAAVSALGGNLLADVDTGTGDLSNRRSLSAAVVPRAMAYGPGCPADFVQGVCGQTIWQSVTLTQDILSCPHDGIIVGADDATLNGSDFKITGIGNGAGVLLVDVNRASVEKLFVSGFENGIDIRGGNDNTASSNSLRNNAVGALLSSTSGNTITRNIIAANTLGISTAAAGNKIFHNIFMNNTAQTSDGGGNTWADPIHQFGNYWGNYWGKDDGSSGRAAGDSIGDTRLMHEGVDNAPLLDPSIPEMFGTLPCADWWLFWRGGWSPVTIQVTDPFGRSISRDLNQIGDNAFYAEDEQTEPGSKVVQILIHRPCSATSADGLYSFQMTAQANLTYSMTSSASERGQIIFKHEVEDRAMAAGETQYVDTVIKETVDPGTGQIKLDVQLEVPIDVKPGTFPNSINFGSGGVTPVAILSTPTFNATTVDPTTVMLAGAHVALRGKGTLMSSLEDVNRDGLLDLVVQVRTDAFRLTQADTQANLTGKTLDGSAIRGVDSVRVVP